SAFNANVAQAGAPLSANTAIRGESAVTVYWYANDGKRYVFPNAATYFTWFPSWDSVRTITDADLISIPLGGNATYRPGAKLVKINTDPRTYAVAKGGVLRHVTSESLASQLYGADWRSDVHDIPDVYFTNYTVGTPIYNASDYNVSNEYNGVSTPSDSLKMSNQGTSNGPLHLSADRINIDVGDAVILGVTHSQILLSNYPSGHRIEIYESRANRLVKTCTLPALNCEVTVYPQLNGSDNYVQYYAALRDGNSNTLLNAYSQQIRVGTPYQTYNTGTRFTTMVSKNTVNAGEQMELIATLRSGDALPSNYRIEIQDPRTAQSIKTCWNVTTCSTSINMMITGGITNIIFHARLVDGNGTVIADEWFPGVSITNGSTANDLTISTDKTSINSGDAIMVSAWSSDTFNVSRIEVRDERDNSLVFTCYSVQNCSQSRTFFRRNTSENSFRLYAQLKDWNGTVLRTTYSPTIMFNGVGQTGMLTLTADRTSITSGQSVQLSASYNATLPTNGRLEIQSFTYGAAYPGSPTILHNFTTVKTC
ncbi:MAG: hypothetical protein NUW08_02240, partial [Candidatus Uhrbacteria bacterium]|nr:hypothetical protein [Candidatus Uhrbacteria bacterium]